MVVPGQIVLLPHAILIRRNDNTMAKDEFRIGKYRLLELLSEGRYTDIWLAEHIDIKKKVAIPSLLSREMFW